MKLYFMGICGTAMGNVAALMQKEGHEVCGADLGIYPPMSDLLESHSITCYEGWDEKRLEKIAPDLVVVGNVVSRGHPEMEWLLESRAFPYASLPQLLHEQILSKRKNIVVAGTHGKTTTSAIAACLLLGNGQRPGYLIGGVPRDLDTGATLGDRTAPFVIEGDEYDTAFFDKRSKFIHYVPNILILNNLEFDHADIFRDLEDVQRTFRHVTRIVPRNGSILINGDDPYLAELGPIDWTTVLKVGVGKQNDLRIEQFEEGPEGVSFELQYKGKLWDKVHWGQSGLYNVRNAAMAALAAALSVSDDPCSFNIQPLSQYKGVKRRQESLWSCDRVQIIEDFGHHPTAISQTLQAMRLRCPNDTIHACFEPRSNTARTRVFQESLPEALAHADCSYIGAVHRSGAMATGQSLDTQHITESIKQINPDRQSFAFPSNEALLDGLKRQVDEEGRSTVIFFSNGSFDGIIQDFVSFVQQ